MKISRNDFLKLVGAGSAGIGAAAVMNGGPVLTLERPSDVMTDSKVEAPAPTLKPVPDGIAERFPHGSGYYDAVQGMLYDRITFPRGSVLPHYFPMFSSPRGYVCPYSNRIKENGDTNMYSACQLHMPRTFWIQRAHIMVDPATGASDLKAIRRYGWQFTIAQKVYAQGSLLMDAASRKLTDIFKPRLQPTRETRDFEKSGGFYIPSLDYFDVTFRGPDNGYRLNEDLDLAFAFEGVDFRPIQ
jgi:hypothetical protein